MSLAKYDLASADGAYIRADGSEVKDAKYLEIVMVLKTANDVGEVYVIGFDSKAEYFILESSLTPITGQVRPIV